MSDNETTTEEGPSHNSGYLTPVPEPEREMADTKKEFGINKPTPFDGNRKEIQSFMQDCKVYLTINGHIYTTDDAKIAFVLSFMNEKEAKRWKENYLSSLINDLGNLNFPTLTEFWKKLLDDFKPANKGKDAAHQIAILRQGKKSAEETITEFRLLTNQAGYANTTDSDHLHLIEKLQTVLNSSLVKRVLLLDDVPTTIDKWAEKAIQIDNNYRQTMEIMERLAGDKRGSKSSGSSSSNFRNNKIASNSNNWRKKEERDPDAMDVDAMTTEKRAYLMKRGACFICERPGHMAKEHDEFVKKQEEDRKGKWRAPQKQDLKAIHALIQGLSKAETAELLAMTKPKDEENKEVNDEDF